MNIVVCTKQVPDTAATLKVDEQSNVSWGDAPLVINPWDEYAIEEAIRLKEKFGGKVTVLSVGPEQAKEALKQAVAMGCDDAQLISDPIFDGSDALATTHILAQAIKKLGDVDVVVFGKQAIDGDTGLVPAGVARRLGWPLLSYVAKIDELDAAAKSLKVTRLLEQGRQGVASKLPAVISVVKEINEPRYPSFMNIRKASKLAIPTLNAAAIGADADKVGRAHAATQWVKTFPLPARTGNVEIISGDSPQAIAAALADKLMAEKVI
ncbi:MAG: electron transfer flavoprotein subunit beta/FixA family protein [Anaerolineae bacterium]